MAADIDTTYQEAIDAGKINGVVLCAMDTKGDFIYKNALGTRTLPTGEKRPQQLDDVLWLASATKLITTIAALQCIEDGILTLDGDISLIAPDLASRQVITGFSEDGETPLLEPSTRPITLEMLLTHSSGLAYEFLNPDLMKWSEKFSASQEGVLRGVEEAFGYPLSFQPGDGWLYGPGLDWTGKIIERATGQTLGEHIKVRIFEPLNIEDASFWPVTREDLRARLVDLNPQDPEGLGMAVAGGTGDMNKRSQGDFGGHGLYMTGADYIKVLHSILANDGKLLTPSTVDDMFRNHLSTNAAAGQQAALSSPLGDFFRLGVGREIKIGYGLGGIVTLQDSEGWYGEHTLSWGGGVTLTWFIDRKNDLCGVGAVQSALPVDIPAIEILKQTFRRDIYRKRAEWKG
ncbi:hypothetical protein LTR84_001543 [Exophiala bonariae]|uniref:Beta-lactamase-related domain-containing protein n=1 Tax=Exophiala bonariae TaxID=1690606 RepID=A0AAV9ND23_9EURO|nr:hypothetical protein LTR84_001543 [Exophiala bonariae]